jgi:soluble lytic murein transglycosylase-like protein
LQYDRSERRFRRLGLCAIALAVLVGAKTSAAAERGTLNEDNLAMGITLPSQGLPRVLSSKDEKLYRDIFRVQEKGDWKTADRLIAQLGDKRLMGHLLEQRYMHPTAYRSKYTELKTWLDHYNDLPGADRIYRLALKRRPANYKNPQKPISHRLASIGEPVYSYRSDKPRSRSQTSRVRQIQRQIRTNVLRTRLTVTEKLLASGEVRSLFDRVEIDEGYAKVAAAWYYYGKPEKAFELADKAADRSGSLVWDAHWIAGLAAWRLGRFADATAHFEGLAEAESAPTANAAAGAYWAARGHLKLQHPSEVSRWLRQAAAHPRSFYGLLAHRSLGTVPQFAFGAAGLNGDVLAQLESKGATSRALALVQVGQRDRAEAEIMGYGTVATPEEAAALLHLADLGGLPRSAFKLGNLVAYGSLAGNGDGVPIDAALYPIPPWQPEDGFKLDKALIYALIRQESAYNPDAISGDGARGLMQIMPRTASYVSQGSRYHGSRRDELFEPGLNLSLGQRYLDYLLNYRGIDGDLFRLTTAYNGGPGNLNKWEQHIQAGDDPLLFIESLPSRETRTFIERVLANLWIYRRRLNQPSPSLDLIAAGDRPIYTSLDINGPEVAQYGKD